MNKISDSNFDQDVLSSSVPVVVDIYADWCSPCKLLTPILEKLAKYYGNKVAFVKMDGESEVETVQHYSVSSLPTLLFFKNGKLEKKISGLQSETMLRSTLDSFV